MPNRVLWANLVWIRSDCTARPDDDQARYGSVSGEMSHGWRSRSLWEAMPLHIARRPYHLNIPHDTGATPTFQARRVLPSPHNVTARGRLTTPERVGSELEVVVRRIERLCK